MHCLEIHTPFSGQSMRIKKLRTRAGEIRVIVRFRGFEKREMNEKGFSVEEA